MNWNTSNQLPFNPEAPQRQPLNLNLNTPPLVPRYDGPAQLQQLAPLVAAACAIEIQNRATSNPLRMFMFNQYSNNDFNNEDFAALVVGTLDYIGMETQAGRYQNLEQAAQSCVPQMCEMMCAINLRIFQNCVPSLENYINGAIVQTLRNTIANFDSLVQRINNWKRTGNPGGQQGGGWANSGGTWGNSGGSWGQQAPQAQAGFGSRWAGGSSNAPQPSMGSSGLFQSGNRVSDPNQSQTSSSVVTGKYASDSPMAQPFKPRTPQQQPQQQQESTVNVAQNEQPNEAPANSGDIAWRPSREFPYLPAAAPSLGDLWLRRHANGVIEPFIKERNPTDMDYERHATSSFGPAPKGLDLSHAADTMARIEQGVKQLNKAQELPKEQHDTPEYSTFIKRETIVDTSEASAWLNGALNRLTATDGRIPDVYRMYALIADPIVTRHDETDAVLNFGSSKTFIELREKLNSAMNEISPELWGAVNLKLTNLVNRVLRVNLGMPTLAIDSFVSDIGDLIDVLEKKGKLIYDAFLKNQRDLIHSSFLTINQEHMKGFSEDLLADRTFAENAKPAITFLASNYSFTYLNSLSYELDLELAQGAPVMVTKALTPAFNQMLADLFKDVTERGNTFERHLISTIDGRIMEATKGFIGDDVYLLTLLK